MFCSTLLNVHSSFASILMGKRELVALLSLSSGCLVIVVWLSLSVPWVCLQFVIVVFPDQTHYFLECKTEKWNSQCEHEQPMEKQKACFARATEVWLAVNHDTSVSSG